MVRSGAAEQEMVERPRTVSGTWNPRNDAFEHAGLPRPITSRQLQPSPRSLATRGTHICCLARLSLCSRFDQQMLASRSYLAGIEYESVDTIPSAVSDELGSTWRAAVGHVRSAFSVLTVGLLQLRIDSRRAAAWPQARFRQPSRWDGRAGCAGELRCEGADSARLCVPARGLSVIFI